MPIQAVTAGRHNQRAFIRPAPKGRVVRPIFGVKVYEARPRKDGAFVWRLLRVEREVFYVLGHAIQAARKYAEKHNLPHFPALKHGDRFVQVIQ